MTRERTQDVISDEPWTVGTDESVAEQVVWMPADSELTESAALARIRTAADGLYLARGISERAIESLVRVGLARGLLVGNPGAVPTTLGESIAEARESGRVAVQIIDEEWDVIAEYRV